jgi:hypothetical protein
MVNKSNLQSKTPSRVNENRDSILRNIVFEEFCFLGYVAMNSYIFCKFRCQNLRFYTLSLSSRCLLCTPALSHLCFIAAVSELWVAKLYRTQKAIQNNLLTLFLFETNASSCRNSPWNRPWRLIGLWDLEAATFSKQSAHRWWWGQTYAPLASLYPQEDSWYSFLLKAESTPGPYCSWKG